ncbi:hypothetical protein Hdeb2414_s0212g00835111 [Helianthus debilis subsp. tardiflorus]
MIQYFTLHHFKTSKHQNTFSLFPKSSSNLLIYNQITGDIQLYPQSPAKIA